MSTKEQIEKFMEEEWIPTFVEDFKSVLVEGLSSKGGSDLVEFVGDWVDETERVIEEKREELEDTYGN